MRTSRTCAPYATPSTTCTRSSALLEPAALQALEARLGHRFADPSLLDQALRHSSVAAEGGGASNERLEFLGDAVLDLVVGQQCYERFPEADEGVLSTIRRGVVSAPSLAAAAVALDLGPVLQLGRGEARDGGATKPGLLSDAYEAVLGAIYLDAGLEAAHRFVTATLGSAIDAEAAQPGHEDHKSLLQEALAKAGRPAPRYEVEGTGPDHEPWFAATVVVGHAVLGRGEGRSKKSAEQEAARAALGEISRA